MLNLALGGSGSCREMVVCCLARELPAREVTGCCLCRELPAREETGCCFGRELPARELRWTAALTPPWGEAARI